MSERGAVVETKHGRRLRLVAIGLAGAAVIVALVLRHYSSAGLLASEEKDWWDTELLARDLTWFLRSDSRRMAKSFSSEHRQVVVWSHETMDLHSKGQVVRLASQFQKTLLENADKVLQFDAGFSVETRNGEVHIGSIPFLTIPLSDLGKGYSTSSDGGASSEEEGLTIRATYDRGRARGSVVLHIYGKPAYTTLFLAEFPRR